VAERYSDLVSASRFGTKVRGGWDQVVADVSAGKLDVILLWDVSRGDRTVETWAAFLSRCRENGVLIHGASHGRTYDPRNHRDWRDLINEGVEAAFDSEKKSVDVRRGVAGAALAGKKHGASAYGFDRRYDPSDRRIYTEVPNDDAPVAAAIIERIAREDPIVMIERDLNEAGILGPAGGPWRRKTIRKMALNPVYIGYRDHNGTWHKGNWSGIVPESVFYRARAVLLAEGRVRSAPGRYKYLLSYLATCAVCQGQVQFQPANRGASTARYQCHLKGCVRIAGWEFDEYMTRLLLARLCRPDARAVFCHGDEALHQAQAEVRRLKDLLEEARESFESGEGISAEALARRERKLEPQLRAAQERVIENSTAGAVLAFMGDEFNEEIARPRWDGLSVAGRRSIIKAVFEKIELALPPERVTRWTKPGRRLELAAKRVTVKWRTS
jgi:DNA invertase Pin-like site-specific DNA recombinase